MTEQAREWRKLPDPEGHGWNISEGEAPNDRIVAWCETDADADAIIRDHEIAAANESIWRRMQAAEAEAARWKAIAGQLAECVKESGEYAEGSPRKFRKIEALAAFDAANAEAPS